MAKKFSISIDINKVKYVKEREFTRNGEKVVVANVNADVVIQDKSKFKKVHSSDRFDVYKIGFVAERVPKGEPANYIGDVLHFKFKEVPKEDDISVDDIEDVQDEGAEEEIKAEDIDF